MSTTTNQSGAKKRIFSLLLAAITAGILAGAVTLLERHFARRYAHLEEALKWAGKKGDYFRYDSNVGWLGKPNVSGRHNSGAWISQNEHGFRDTPWNLHTGKPHVLLLGDSNAWGYGVDDDEHPAAVLNRIAPDYRWFNAGMNGFGTDQAFLLFQQLQPLIEPVRTVLLVCGNDRDDNASIRVRGYNKPAFTVEDDRLILQNDPVPRPEEGENLWAPFPERVFAKTHSYLLYHIAQIIEARKSREKVARTSKVKRIEVRDSADPTELIVRDLFRAAGGRLLVAAISKDESLKTFCRAEQIPFLDLSETPAVQPGPNAYPTGPPKHGHWTPEGNRIAAEEIAKALHAIRAEP